jgi:hypothetical protein
MNDTSTPERDGQTREKGLLDRHPKFSIYLIAGVFYLVLLGMCAFVVVLIWIR